MWGFNLIFIVVSCILLTFPFGVSCTHSVPVFSVGTSEFPEEIPALNSLDEGDFQRIIADRANNNPVFVFAEETLSPEDFALRDTDGKFVLSSIASLKSTFSAYTTYWPLVKNPIEAVTQLFDKNIVKTSIKDLIDNPAFIVHSNDILIIELNDAEDNENRLDMLKRHDKYIIEVYRRYADEKNILILLTGYRSSWVLSDELRSSRKIRQVDNSSVVKADNTSTSIILNNTDLLIYMNSSASLNFEGTRVFLKDFELRDVNKDKSTLNATLKHEDDISMMFHFVFGGGYWSLTNISVVNATAEYYVSVRDVYAPVGFSYHCHGQIFFNSSNSKVNISLPGFQMQLYFNTTEGFKKFGDAYDCVGFMSAPIWSGLFVTFIMALIMTFGLSMMMDIKTMDRFDDPKGKTITINASE